MGGTRFFGRVLVYSLLERGHDVTILTSGKTKDPFGTKVKRLKASRTDRVQMHYAINNSIFDIVYDQISFSPVDAQIVCELFIYRILIKINK